jgi:two-component system chemotaxis response regulator CheB
MRRIRVLIVDDAVVVRRLVTEALSADPLMEVVGAAANGRIALAKIPQVNPDLVVLDVEMPELNGLETLREIRKDYPRLPVIMFSTLTERGAATTLDALALGANDYVTKPANVGSVVAAIERVRSELIPKAKALCGADAGGVSATHVEPRTLPRIGKPPVRPATPPPPVEVVAIGVSTGGPNALAQVIPQLPAGFPVPVLVVQHMPPIFTKLLAERLSAQAQMPVEEARFGARPDAGTIWMAPGDFHLVVRREGTRLSLQTHKGPFENSCRPAVDVLFRSVAEIYGAASLAVVMTGMGQDGLRGCEDIRGAGGQVVVQDEASSVVWGMPGFVANAGLADKILPLDQLPGEIVRRVEKGRRR